MHTRQFDTLRLRAAVLRFLTIAWVILPIVLAACGQNDDGGGGPAY